MIFYQCIDVRPQLLFEIIPMKRLSLARPIMHPLLAALFVRWTYKMLYWFWTHGVRWVSRCSTYYSSVWLLRDGTIKIGDRLLGINGVNVSRCTLAECLSILRHTEGRARIVIEYDVSILGKQNNWACLVKLILQNEKYRECTQVLSQSFNNACVWCLWRIIAIPHL